MSIQMFPRPHGRKLIFFRIFEVRHTNRGQTKYSIYNIERVFAINWDSPRIYDDYPEDFSQGDKNEFIHIQGEPITHTIDETFDIQKQKVIDFIDYNHTLVQLASLVVDEFSIDEQSFNLLKLELEHIKHYDFIGVDELLSIFLVIQLTLIWKY